MAQKFLVVDDSFKMGFSVEYHRELLPSKSNYREIHGGGWFHISDSRKLVFLYGSSEEFGTASQERILASLKESLLSVSLAGYGFFISDENSLSKVFEKQRLNNRVHFTYEF